MSILNPLQHINLTNDQNDVLLKMQDFLAGDASLFILRGYAGTGKTTLLKGVCEYLSQKKQVFRLMAPTGRAAMVLNEKTGFAASTIHRGIYNMDELRVDESEGAFVYNFGLHANQDCTKAVYLIDEASMISDRFSDDEFFCFGSGYLLQDLFQFVFEGKQNRKIVFIGDDAQLPPVDMNFSPALCENYLLKTFNKPAISATMRQVVRQAYDSGILQTAGKLRQSIEKNEFNIFEIPTSYADIQNIEQDGFIHDYAGIAKNTGVGNAIVITHSNKQALHYNRIIRAKRYGEKAGVVQKKDILIITRNNYNYQVELFNGMFVEVMEVGAIIYTANPRFKIQGGKTIQRELKFREVLIAINSSGTKYHLRCTLIDNFLEADEGRLHPYDQRALFIDFKNRHSKLKPGSGEFKEALMKDLYFNALQAKYGYAITCHKSQGGEWENVIVDFEVFLGKNTSGFYRWSYTAITRAAKMLYCLAAPAFNALSKFVVREVQLLSKPDANQYYLPVEADYDFVEYRLTRIKEICGEQEITCSFQVHVNQLVIAFEQSAYTGSVQLWFGKKGFTKTFYNDFQNESFKELIQTLIQESLYVKNIDFSPRFQFQNELHRFLIEIFQEENTRVTNIIQKEWSDRYYICTDAECAYIDFFFTKEHFYSNAQAHTTLGNKDEKLQRIINKLRG